MAPRPRTKRLPAGVHARRHASGRETYSIDYRDASGRRRQEAAGTSIADAVALLARRRREADAGELPDVQITGTTTLSSYSEACFRTRAEKGVRTTEKERSVFALHIAPHLGAMRLDAIRPRDVERWVDGLTRAGALAPKTIRNAHGVLAAVLQRARFEGAIVSNPARDLPRGTLPVNVPRRKVRPWTRAEVELLISDPRVPWDRRVAYSIAGFTGARLGEVAGMRWRDLDVDAPIAWRWALRMQYDGQPLKTERGAGERPRDIPIHPELRRVLAAWKLEGWPKYIGRHPRPDDFVVPRPDGTVHSAHSLGGKTLARHAKALGLPREGASFHSFRHAAITLARVEGARDLWLERVTHNAKGATILDRYTASDWTELVGAISCIPFEVHDMARVVTLFGDAVGDAGPISTVSEPFSYGAEGNRTGGDSRDTAVTGDPGAEPPPRARADFPAHPASVPIAVTRVTKGRRKP